MRKQFVKTITELAEKDERIVLIIADVDWGFDEFRKLFPERFLNLGLTEQSIVAIAGGMASQGLMPVVVSITPFLLERAFEFIKLNIDATNLPVMLVGYDDYSDITHVCLDKKKMVSIFHNVRAYFPQTLEEVKTDVCEAIYLPSFIFLKKCT